MSKSRILPLFLALTMTLLCGCGKGENAPDDEGESVMQPQVTIVAPDLEQQAQKGKLPDSAGTWLQLPNAGETLRISEGGTYVLSGSGADGQILIDAPDDAEVCLILNGLDLTKSGHAVIFAKNAACLVVEAAEGSVNRLSSTGGFPQKEDDKVDAAIYAKCDLALGGSGTLTILCDGGHGALSKDTLRISGGTLNIRASKKGLSGKDGLRLTNGKVYIQSGTKGLIAEGDGDGGGELEISGGSLTVQALDDAIHAANSIRVTGGELILQTEDDAIHADNSICVDGGSIQVVSCKEGLEARDITINGGSISIFSLDDGINASLGKDPDKGGDPLGGSPFADDSGASLTINGGTLLVNAGGDGLDVNGDLLITGGAIYVSGPVREDNGALDYGSSGTITGGIIVAAGSAGMAMNFGSKSTQGSILLNVGEQPAGSSICLQDSSGKALIRYTPDKRYTTVVLSCPELKQGQSYTVTAGSFSQTLTLETLIYGKGLEGGPGIVPPGGGPGGPGGPGSPGGGTPPGSPPPGGGR